MKATTKISKKEGEYRVRLFIDGVYQAGGDYFTDDKTDAKRTAEAMVRDPRPTAIRTAEDAQIHASELRDYKQSLSEDSEEEKA